jgi:hypothetical protein
MYFKIIEEKEYKEGKNFTMLILELDSETIDNK